MRKFFISILVLGLVSCSSKEKSAESESAAAPESVSVQEEPAAPATPEAAPAKEKKEVAAPAEPAMGEGASFPDVEGTERSSAECAAGSDSRRIVVIDTADKHCGVVYHRGGAKKTVAYARNDMSYCDNVLGKIKANLAGAGFNCGGEAPAQAPAAEPAKEQQQ